MHPVQVLLQRVTLVDDLHLRRIVLDVVDVVGARVDRVGRVGLEPCLGAFIQHLDHRTQVRRTGVEVAVRRAAEIDEFVGAEGVAEDDEDLHELGLLGALLAVQDRLLLGGQFHLVFGGFLGRGVRLGRAREGGFLTRRLAVGSEALHVGIEHVLRPVRRLATPG